MALRFAMIWLNIADTKSKIAGFDYQIVRLVMHILPSCIATFNLLHRK